MRGRKESVSRKEEGTSAGQSPGGVSPAPRTAVSRSLMMHLFRLREGKKAPQGPTKHTIDYGYIYRL